MQAADAAVVPASLRGLAKEEKDLKDSKKILSLADSLCSYRCHTRAGCMSSFT